MNDATEGKPLMKLLGACPNSRSRSALADGAWAFQRLKRILREFEVFMVALENEDFLPGPAGGEAEMVGH